MSLEALKSNLAGFGRSIDLAGVEPDGEGYLALSFDDLVVHLQHEEDAERVVCFARIGEVEPVRREAILALLLGANLFWQGAKGATLAIEPETDVVFIQSAMQLVKPDEVGFADWMGGFVEIAVYWRGRLQAVNEGAPIDEDGPEDRGGGPGVDPANLVFA